MKILNECKQCGVKKESSFYGKIFLTNDGYCSVCNAKYKERPRSKSIFEFTIIPGENTHLDSQGRKLTKNRKLLNSIYKKERAINAAILYQNIKAKRNPTLEEWIKND